MIDLRKITAGLLWASILFVNHLAVADDAEARMDADTRVRHFSA